MSADVYKRQTQLRDASADVAKRASDMRDVQDNILAVERDVEG